MCKNFTYRNDRTGTIVLVRADRYARTGSKIILPQCIQSHKNGNDVPIANFATGKIVPVRFYWHVSTGTRVIFAHPIEIHPIRDTSLKDVVTFSTTFHPGFFYDLALLFVL